MRSISNLLALWQCPNGLRPSQRPAFSRGKVWNVSADERKDWGPFVTNTRARIIDSPGTID